MASVTLYDGETGDPVAGTGAVDLTPVVAANDHAEVSFALDPRRGRALVQFVADPGARRLVAGLELGEDDDLHDLNRAIQERLAPSDFSLASPATAHPHLNVFHYLAVADPVALDPDLRGRLVATDDHVAIGVPTAADAVGVVAFFRERAPWKPLAVHTAETTVSSDDVDVTVVVDGEFDAVTILGTGERPVQTDGAPTGSREGIRREAAPGADEPADATADRSGATATGGSGATATHGDGRGTAGDESPVLRIYDGTTGELAYDSRRTGDVPARVSDDVKRFHRDGLALFVDPDAGLLRAVLEARGAGVDTPFVVEYDRRGPDADLRSSFVDELAGRVDDLGVEFVVDVAGEAVDYGLLTDTPDGLPAGVAEADLEWLRRTDEPLEFAAPGGVAAVELATVLRRHLGDDRSIAVSAAGRTDDLAGTDVVVAPDPDCEAVEPRGGTATGLAEHRLQERLRDVGASVRATVERVDEVTGTVEARQRVFAAALSGGSLARRGLTVVPVDDRPIARRRRQARYLVLYGLLLAGLAAGAHAGQFDPLTGLLADTYRFRVGPVAGTPLAAFEATYAVDGVAVVAGSLAALVVGAYWLLGYPLGPGAAARSLARTVRRQVTGGAGSGTAPATVRSLAEPIRSSFDDLAAARERLADADGTTAASADDFGAFLERELLAGPMVPEVTLVRRGTRWRQLLLGIAMGVLVGAIGAGALLVALWFAVDAARADPTLAVDALLGAVALTVLASAAKAVAVVVGRGRPPRGSTAR